MEALKRIGLWVFFGILVTLDVFGWIYVYPNAGNHNFDKEFRQYLETKNESDYNILLNKLNEIDINYDVSKDSISTKYFKYSLENNKVEIDKEAEDYILCKTMENMKVFDDDYHFKRKSGKYISIHSDENRIVYNGNNYYYNSFFWPSFLYVFTSVALFIIAVVFIFMSFEW